MDGALLSLGIFFRNFEKIPRKFITLTDLILRNDGLEDDGRCISFTTMVRSYGHLYKLRFFGHD